MGWRWVVVVVIVASGCGSPTVRGVGTTTPPATTTTTSATSTTTSTTTRRNCPLVSSDEVARAIGQAVEDGGYREWPFDGELPKAVTVATCSFVGHDDGIMVNRLPLTAEVDAVYGPHGATTTTIAGLHARNAVSVTIGRGGVVSSTANVVSGDHLWSIEVRASGPVTGMAKPTTQDPSAVIASELAHLISTR